MQSRNFFSFGPQFNILTSSLMVTQSKTPSTIVPPEDIFLIAQNDNNLITQNDNFYITNNP